MTGKILMTIYAKKTSKNVKLTVQDFAFSGAFLIPITHLKAPQKGALSWQKQKSGPITANDSLESYILQKYTLIWCITKKLLIFVFQNWICGYCF
jgi:hypothetical protein